MTTVHVHKSKDKMWQRIKMRVADKRSKKCDKCHINARKNLIAENIDFPGFSEML